MDVVFRQDVWWAVCEMYPLGNPLIAVKGLQEVTQSSAETLSKDSDGGIFSSRTVTAAKPKFLQEQLEQGETAKV